MLTRLLGERLDEMGLTYAEYLASEHWQEVRRRYRASRMPQQCLRCRSKVVDLHHLTYKRLGEERLTDLAPLCRGCHTMLHEFDRASVGNQSNTETLLRHMCGWTRKYARVVFQAYHPEWTRKQAAKKARKKAKRAAAPKPKKVRFGDPRERKWMSGPLGAAAREEP